jgi:hypothetical protein
LRKYPVTNLEVAGSGGTACCRVWCDMLLTQLIIFRTSFHVTAEVVKCPLYRCLGGCRGRSGRVGKSRLQGGSNTGPLNAWRVAVPTQLSRQPYKMPYKFNTNSDTFDWEGASLSETKGDVTAGCDDLIVIVTPVAYSRRRRSNKSSRNEFFQWWTRMHVVARVNRGFVLTSNNSCAVRGRLSSRM